MSEVHILKRTSSRNKSRSQTSGNTRFNVKKITQLHYRVALEHPRYSMMTVMETYTTNDIGLKFSRPFRYSKKKNPTLQIMSMSYGN